MGAFNPRKLKGYCVTLGTILTLVSLCGIGFSLYLLFGEPLAKETNKTYRPNWEEIGPLLAASIISLMVNIALLGGALQLSRRIVLTWLVWDYILVILFWVWYGYSMLKYHGYIDWTEYGMRQCHWCQYSQRKEMLGYMGALSSFVLIIAMIPVHMLHNKIKKNQKQQIDYGYEPEYELQQQEYLHNQYQQQPQQEYQYNQFQYLQQQQQQQQQWSQYAHQFNHYQQQSPQQFQYNQQIPQYQFQNQSYKY